MASFKVFMHIAQLPREAARRTHIKSVALRAAQQAVAFKDMQVALKGTDIVLSGGNHSSSLEPRPHITSHFVSNERIAATMHYTVGGRLFGVWRKSEKKRVDYSQLQEL